MILSKTAVGASQPPLCARQQVLGNPDLLREVLRRADGDQHQTLERVSNLWRQEINYPNAWLKRFHPAVIHEPSRSIYTAHQPQSYHWLCQTVEREVPVSHKKPLRMFGGEPWTLKTGALPRSQNHLDILDKVARLRCIGYYNTRFAPSRERLESDRMKSLDFLLHRAYRLEHDLHIPMFREDTKAFVVLTVRSYLAILAAFSCLGIPFLCLEIACLCLNIACSPAWGAAAAAAGLVGLVVCLKYAWKYFSGATDVMMHGDTPMLRNLVFAYPDYLRLNRWAREVADEVHIDAINNRAQDVPAG